MLLPQSPAFHTLKNRLAAVPEIGLLRLQLELRDRKNSAHADRAHGAAIDFGALLKTYRAVQEKHSSRTLCQAQARRASGASTPSPAATP